MRELGEYLSYISIAILAVTYIWSFIIAYRQNILWLLGMVVIWFLVYPIFIVRYWSKSKNNFLSFAIGIILLVISFYILAETNPNKAL